MIRIVVVAVEDDGVSVEFGQCMDECHFFEYVGDIFVLGGEVEFVGSGRA